MFGFPILEVAIGLCFVYLLLSLICTTVNETIVALTRRRGKMLEQGIETLLGDAGIKKELYEHPLIKSMTQGGRKPSYISGNDFALALMDIVTGNGEKPDDPDALQAQAGLNQFQGARHLKTALNTVLANQSPALQTAQQKIANWFDQSMNRVTGAYKRRTTLWIWGLAIAITLCINANTVRITETLWSNQAVRSAVVNQAQARAQQAPPEPMLLVDYDDPNNPNASKPINIHEGEALTAAEQATLGQLVGWKGDAPWWWTHVIGWLFTVVALTLGAPFWFDMLNRFVNLRNAGKPSTDAQPPQPAAVPVPQAVGKGAGAP
jgi:hypothetical protein